MGDVTLFPDITVRTVGRLVCWECSCGAVGKLYMIEQSESLLQAITEHDEAHRA